MIFWPLDTNVQRLFIMAKKEARTEKVGVRFRLSELAQLDRAAKQEGISRSEFIREGATALVLALRPGTSEDSNDDR